MYKSTDGDEKCKKCGKNTVSKQTNCECRKGHHRTVQEKHLVDANCYGMYMSVIRELGTRYILIIYYLKLLLKLHLHFIDFWQPPEKII